MTNKQLYNLVFENFVQAKKELIREGYMKRNLDEVDFNEIFDQTKKKMLEEKVKSLQRENEMLKKQMGLQEAGVSNPTGYGERGSDAMDGVFDFIDKVLAKYGNTGSKISVIKKAMKTKGIIESDRDLNQFGLILQSKMKEGFPMKKAILSALRQMRIRTPELTTLAENRKRRRY
jgi:hypothetical protein